MRIPPFMLVSITRWLWLWVDYRPGFVTVVGWCHNCGDFCSQMALGNVRQRRSVGLEGVANGRGMADLVWKWITTH